MRASAMTGDTADDGYTLIVLEEFLIDLADHLVHVTGCLFLRLGVAGEIQPVRAAVLCGSMTEIAFHTQRMRPAMHDMIEAVFADVLRQYFQVSFRLVVLGAEGGHADDDDSEKSCDHGDLSGMKHSGNFGSLR